MASISWRTLSARDSRTSTGCLLSSTIRGLDFDFLAPLCFPFWRLLCATDFRILCQRVIRLMICWVTKIFGKVGIGQDHLLRGGRHFTQYLVYFIQDAIRTCKLDDTRMSKEQPDKTKSRRWCVIGPAGRRLHLFSKNWRLQESVQ